MDQLSAHQRAQDAFGVVLAKVKPDQMGLAVETLSAARERISPAFRGPGRPFGEEQPCPEGRPPADQLAAFLGRAVD